jgi:hypothetical protein
LLCAPLSIYRRHSTEMPFLLERAPRCRHQRYLGKLIPAHVAVASRDRWRTLRCEVYLKQRVDLAPERLQHSGFAVGNSKRIARQAPNGIGPAFRL